MDIPSLLPFSALQILSAGMFVLAVAGGCGIYGYRKVKKCLKAARQELAALQISEERFRVLASNASDVIWTIDLDGNFTYVSPSIERQRGFLAEEVMQQSIEDALTPDSAQKCRHALENFARKIRAGEFVEDFRAEIEQRCKDGTTIWVEITVSPMSSSAGGNLGLLGVTRDISERKKRDTELLIAAAVFESHDGIFVTDAETRILRTNQAFCDISGYMLEEVIGENPRIFKSGRHDRFFYEEMWQSITNAGAWHGEVWNKRKNGEIFPANITISAIKSTHGATTHYVATMQDISARKLLENQVLEMAYRDPLTQLPNRRLFHEKLTEFMSKAICLKHKLGLLFIDLDGFKPINDTHGHEAGDFILKSVAERLKARLRASDIVARIGGDELIVLLPGIVAAEDALRVGEKIREEISVPYHFSTSHDLMTTASIGVAVFPDHADNEHDLMRRGDAAMYEAKSAGGNKLVLSTGADMPALVSENNLLRLTWRQHYQCGNPQIDADHRKLFELGNRLLFVVQAPEKDREQLKQLAHELVIQLRNHFLHEEAILCELGYAELASHKLAHEKLEKQAINFMNSIGHMSSSVLGETAELVVGEIVARHMLVEDFKFSHLFSVVQSSMCALSESG